ncbi:hypothetical protein BRD09_07570 [Halobacteriales archaeon SW_10_68_16]|jgi:membrane protein YdbS with pleckstrin-like domain|nr:MAG: hypothetical protein BRD09_07570 [Halobacteriales archaeon SW_10_68_16]
MADDDPAAPASEDAATPQSDDGAGAPGSTTETETGTTHTAVGAAGDERVDQASASVEGETGTEQTSPAEDVTAYTTGERGVSARVQVYWGIRLLVGVAILAGIARLAIEGFGVAVDPRAVPAGAVALGLLGLVWVHLRYRVWSYRLRADALYLERGVFTRVTTVAPHVRIQHVDTSRRPLERTLGLSTLVVYTAGSRGADVSIPGLTPGEASDLQRRLKELAIETEGGDAL